MEHNTLHVGKNVAFFINLKKIGKKEMSEMIGVTRQQLRHIELSKDLSTSMLRKISFVLNIDMKEFISDYDNIVIKYGINQKMGVSEIRDQTNNTTILEMQYQAVKTENLLLKELINTKDELIKLINSK